MKIYSLLDFETAISALNVPSQADLHDPVVFFGHHEKGRNIKKSLCKKSLCNKATWKSIQVKSL